MKKIGGFFMKTILTLMMIFSLAVGNNAENAHSALMRIENDAGFAAANVEIVDVGSDNAYLLGLCASDVSVLSSASASFEDGNGGVYCFAFADSSKNAKIIFDKIWKNFEFPACDNAEKAVILTSGKTVALFKGDSAKVEALARIYGKHFGVGGMKIVKNSSKIK